MRILSKVINVVFYVEIALVVLLSLVCLIGKPFGFNNYAVVSGSMTPTIQVGSMVYVNTNISGSDISPGDMVAFYTDKDATKPCVHRAVSIDKANNTITTKGDANNSVDISPITYDEVIGKACLVVPYLGFICDFVMSSGTSIALVIIATMLLSLSVNKLTVRKKQAFQYA